METENHFKNRWNIAKRTVLLLAILCINVAYSFAQDIITLKNGDDVKALVQEIGDTDVKYKKFENQNGPVYSMKKSEILTLNFK